MDAATRLDGQTALVTGATSGLGLEAARQLAGLGARVLVHGRSADRAAVAADDVAAHGDAAPVWGDFGCFSEVRALAGQVTAATDTVDVLINNAGVFMTERRDTVDGHELSFQVNHLSAFLLTHLLLDSVRAAAHGRVITVSSVAHFRGDLDLDDLEYRAKPFDGYGAYAATKLANVLFAQDLAERLMCLPPTSNVVHPGTVDTKLLRTGFPGAAGSPVALGAAGLVYLASSPDVATITGAYFVEKRRAHPSPKTRDPEVRRKLWDASARMVGL